TAGAPDSDSAIVPDVVVIGIAYPVDLRSTPARYVPMSATSDETVADDASVNVLPSAVSLTGTGTTTLGNDAVAEAGSAYPTVATTNPVVSIASAALTRIMMDPFSMPRSRPATRSAWSGST